MPTSKQRHGGFTLIELMVVVAIIGVLASIAIPSFMRYIAKSKTTEARSQLQKMYSQARVYYLETFGASTAGTTVPHQFPRSEAMTPVTSCCIDLGDGDKCAPSAALWTSPTWTALHFAMDDAHYYQYEFVSAGVSTDATFTARAEGDLDCDGIRSVFEMYGRIDHSGGEVTGSGGVARMRELE